MNKLQMVLENKFENYLFPFFWQHGETREVLEIYMDKIAESGMKAACIEARPHPDFVGQKWWEDLSVIIEKAKEHDMKLWILDDSHFPTGYANGAIKNEYQELAKWYLDMRRFDVAGPIPNGKINMTLLKGRPWDKPSSPENEPILGIYAAKRGTNRTEEKDPILADSIVEITNCYQDEILTWDIPRGDWSIFVMFATRKRGEEATKDYLNPLVKEATKVLLKTVYEPHYEHLKEEFGKTILGFFSDEPRFGNIKGTEASIGRMEMVLPWRMGLEKKLGFEPKYLPLLFAPAYGKEAEIRYLYMDVITKMYNENFTKVLADWCHAHDVYYLGHNIEDNGAHARLGYGTGHYFRGQEAQDFSGIDVIGGQLVPGQPYHHDAFSTGGSNGEFYHYALAKLGSSAAHLDEKKKGRAMCEAYGAYGWNEGLKLMKWITDHLVVRGINYIVPHAFNPKEFPDGDCPPHFYAHGHNPQFRYFPVFTSYTNRLLELFNDGVHQAPAAVLYPAEQEWAGEYMPVEKPIRELTEAQIDCDIVSMDYLRGATVKDKELVIGKESFKVLVIPYGEYILQEIMQKVAKIAREGVRVIFVDGYPYSALPADKSSLEDVKGLCETIPLLELSDACENVREIKLESQFKDCVYYHYVQEKIHYYMFFNENVSDCLNCKVSLPKAAYYYEYDAFSNQLYETDLTLSLSPYESTVIVATDEKQAAGKKFKTEKMKSETLHLTWKVNFADALEYPKFEPIGEVTELMDLRTLPGMDRRTGTASYETEFACGNPDAKAVLELEKAWEVAEVFINGESAGVRICEPYRFELTGLLQEKNEIRIEVTNTLGNQQRDAISQYLVIEPFGITGEVRLFTKE